MEQWKIGTVMEEIYYRLERLKALESLLKSRRTVVYGIGINAKRVLNCLSSLPILGLMDAKAVGQFYYGKKVLSDEEIGLLQVDTILIAAEPEATSIIYRRILPFCLQRDITILDMYGCDEMALHRLVKEQELRYASLTREIIQKKIEKSRVVFFSFQGILCTQLPIQEELFHKTEKCLEETGIYIKDFARNRILAQKRLPCGMRKNLEDIYIVLSTLINMDEKDIKQMTEIEKRVVQEQLKPRKSVLMLLKYAQDQKKDIFICTDLLYGEDIIQKFLGSYGITKYNIISTEGEETGALTGRAIHAACSEVGTENVLFIGNNRKDSLIIPQLYGVDIQLIEDSVAMFWNYSSFGNRKAALEEREDFRKIVDIIEEEYNSPFLCEVDEKRCLERIEKQIGWQAEDTAGQVELFPFIPWEREKDVEKLSFQKPDFPLVSIIVPAYNQFAYTYNCLKSILMNSGDVKYEVILADDGSTDWTKGIEAFVEGVHVLHNKEKMLFLRSCNQAAQYAKGKYILFLNNDTQVQMNWLEPLVNLIEKHSEVGMVGSKLIFPNGRLQEAGGIIWNDGSGCNYGREKSPDAPEYNYVRETDYISGASIMLSKMLWNEIGGFDERYAPAYCEDSDLAFEVRKRGKKVVYQPMSEVVHFEGISNGKDTGTGVKRYQEINKSKLFHKWKEVLLKEQQPAGENILRACDRKGKRKTILIISRHIPTYDRDAGSKTLDSYIKVFLDMGYILKFIPDNFIAEEPYKNRLQQMGVEVFCGSYYKNNIKKWIQENCREIDYAFLNYPYPSIQYIDLLTELKIPVRYYGMDLHFLRNRREYELLGKEESLKKAQDDYEKEAYLIEKSDVVYYPTKEEVELVKSEFHKKEVRQLIGYIYDINAMKDIYEPSERNGILFIGSYSHKPNLDALQWFIQEIFPSIYEKIKAPFYAAGADMPEKIKNIKIPGATMLGRLTEKELEEMYRKVKLVVVPLRYGAGIKGKVIEAMYHGIPVITTTIGAEGIPNGGDVFKIADDEKTFYQKVNNIYDNDQELKRISEKCRKLVAKYYSREAAWNCICQDF